MQKSSEEALVLIDEPNSSTPPRPHLRPRSTNNSQSAALSSPSKAEATEQANAPANDPRFAPSPRKDFRPIYTKPPRGNTGAHVPQNYFPFQRPPAPKVVPAPPQVPAGSGRGSRGRAKREHTRPQLELALVPSSDKAIADKPLTSRDVAENIDADDHFSVDTEPVPSSPTPRPPSPPRPPASKQIVIPPLKPASKKTEKSSPSATHTPTPTKDINNPNFFSVRRMGTTFSSIDDIMSESSSSEDTYDFNATKTKKLKPAAEHQDTPFKPKAPPRAMLPKSKPISITIEDSDDELAKNAPVANENADGEEADAPVHQTVNGNWPEVNPAYIQKSDGKVETTQISLKFSLESAIFGTKAGTPALKLPLDIIDKVEYSRLSTPMLTILLSKHARKSKCWQSIEDFVTQTKSSETNELESRIVFKFSSCKSYVEVLEKISAKHPFKPKLCIISDSVLRLLNAVPPPEQAAPKRVMTRAATAAAQPPNSYLQEVVLVYPPPPAGDSIQITLEDLGRLDPNEFLNDSIIDFYIKWLKMSKLEEAIRDRFYFFSTFFFRKLHQKNTSASNSIAKWTKKEDIFSRDFIVIPINESLHWSLMIVCYAASAVQRAKEGAKPIAVEEAEVDEEKEEAVEDVLDNAKRPDQKRSIQVPIEVFASPSTKAVPAAQPEVEAMRIDGAEEKHGHKAENGTETKKVPEYNTEKEKAKEPEEQEKKGRGRREAAAKKDSKSEKKEEKEVEEKKAPAAKRKKGGKAPKEATPISVDEEEPAVPASKLAVDTNVPDSVHRNAKLSVPGISTEETSESSYDTELVGSKDQRNKKKKSEPIEGENLAATVIACTIDTKAPLCAAAAPPPPEDDNDVIYKPPRTLVVSTRDAIDSAAWVPPVRKARTPQKPKVVTDPNMPCILVFDSLRLRSNPRANNTIRKYLSEEWKRKRGEDFVFDKTNLPVRVTNVPTQDNSSDCGVYLLHYLERFAEVNISVGEFFLNGKEGWFTERVIREKRQFIRDLIEREAKRQELEKQRAAGGTVSAPGSVAPPRAITPPPSTTVATSPQRTISPSPPPPGVPVISIASQTQDDELPALDPSPLFVPTQPETVEAEGSKKDQHGSKKKEQENQKEAEEKETAGEPEKKRKARTNLTKIRKDYKK